jgi:hypothetical protein
MTLLRLLANFLFCPLPFRIDDGETIVRALKTPEHFNAQKGSIKPAAFRPPAGKRKLSVMRQLIGNDACKQKANEICGEKYIGLAVTLAQSVRAAGSRVRDHRWDFCGHAHLNHGFPAPPKGEPMDSKQNLLMVERCRALVRHSEYRNDPNSASKSWSGVDLRLSS